MGTRNLAPYGGLNLAAALRLPAVSPIRGNQGQWDLIGLEKAGWTAGQMQAVTPAARTAVEEGGGSASPGGQGMEGWSRKRAD